MKRSSTLTLFFAARSVNGSHVERHLELLLRSFCHITVICVVALFVSHVSDLQGRLVGLGHLNGVYVGTWSELLIILVRLGYTYERILSISLVLRHFHGWQVMHPIRKIPIYLCTVHDQLEFVELGRQVIFLGHLLVSLLKLASSTVHTQLTLGLLELAFWRELVAAKSRLLHHFDGAVVSFVAHTWPH